MLVIDNFFSFRRMIFLSKQLLVVRVTCSGSAYAQDTSPMSQEGILMTQYFKIDIFFSIYLFVIINISYRSVGKVFCTMDGRGSMVHIHPSSAVNMSLDNKICFNWKKNSHCHTVFIPFVYGRSLVLFFKAFEQEAKLNWVIFHDILVTSRVYMRTVCPIRYEWVKDLLPKLHEVDVYDLSNVAREEVTSEEMTKWEKREAAKRQSGFPKLLFIYKTNKSWFF